jgi:hypothetical protein
LLRALRLLQDNILPIDRIFKGFNACHGSPPHNQDTGEKESPNDGTNGNDEIGFLHD